MERLICEELCVKTILNKIKYGIYEVDIKLFYKIFFSISLFVSASKL